MRWLKALLAAGLVGLLFVFGACTTLLGGFTTSATTVGAEGGGGDDAAGVDAGTHEGGGAEGGGADGGGTGDAGGAEAGPLKITSCTAQLVHNLTADAGTISDDGLTIITQKPVSNNELTVIVPQGTGPVLAYQFRTDRPNDPPQEVIQMLNGKDATTLAGAARSWDDTETYVLAVDPMANQFLFYDWPDTMNISSNPMVSPSGGVGGGGAAMGAASASSFFYGFALGGTAPGIYEQFVGPPFAPLASSATLVASVPQNMVKFVDGQPSYVLADGTVMILYQTGTSSANTTNQVLLSQTQGVIKSQVVMGTSFLPLAFQSDPVGATASVDLSLVESAVDGGNGFGLFTGTIPESQLFSPGIAASVKQVDTSLLGPLGAEKPCWAAYPGKLALVLPSSPGFDMVIIDTATATIDYALVGTSNLLSAQPEAVNCAVGTPTLVGGLPTFDFVWTEDENGNGDSLLYARIVCTGE